MKFNFLLQALVAGLIMFCLSSCDGGGGGGSEDFLDPDQDAVFNSRYDMNQLDGNAIAEMPDTLVGFSDEFVLEPSGFSNVSNSRNGIGPWFPSQGPDNPASPPALEGVFQSSTNLSLLIRNQIYRYEKTADGASIKLFSIDPLNVIGVQGTTADRLYLSGLPLLQAAGSGDPGNTFSGALVSSAEMIGLFGNVDAKLATLPQLKQEINDPPLSAQLPAEGFVRDAIGTKKIDELGEPYLTLIDDIFGYEAIVLPEAVGSAGYTLKVGGSKKWELGVVYWPLEGGMILTSRKIILDTITTTNAELATNKVIEGFYTIVDEYDVLFIKATSPNEIELTNSINQGGGLGATSGGLNLGKIQSTGTFKLNLETLGSQKP
jgi:hypothetical protein